MAEGIESYDHVPQQSRRDKLRELPDHHHRSNFLPFYDPSSSDSSNRFQFHHHPFFDPQFQSPLLPEIHSFPAEPLSLSLSPHPFLASPIPAPLPLGPFTGYASILKGSRFLKPAHHLLQDLCDSVHSSSSSSAFLHDPSSDSFTDSPILDHHHPLPSDSSAPPHKSTLLSMLDEVYRKYKQYYQQIQEVMTSFEYISGLGNAAPYANQAIKAMYKHFKCLKNAILDQLQFNKKTHGDYNQRSVQNPGFLDHQPVWRPQRGLPERAVTVLRAWLFEHFLHPYPSDTDKLMLAKQTGLSRSQVSNWFINARVRLWKPMVEEIYMLETKQQQTQKNLHREDRNANRTNDHHHPSNSLAMDNPSTSTQQIQDTPPKRTWNEPHDVPMGNHNEPLNVSYNLSTHPHVATNTNMAGNNGGVSLTLGLHQNNVIGGFSEPFPVGFPVAATRRFGLGILGNNDGYVMGGHFSRDVLGGQMLHDFVG
ncbi:BEL1-like homeodomain protein 9 [Benincasa hispida]|uniref:BEL1-like homeodomain protein 9 n=1 Tax=Benincasa hispida TaxID=102211 RepID=UPI0019029B07|nr:BEL1-like homeodomain protein 9 [Benincasa hispida]